MNQSPKAPTIKDIAAIVGLHYSTVSLALNSDPRIPERTQKRIQAAAEQIGYRRSEISSSLASFRSAKRKIAPPAIAFISNRPSQEEFHRHPHMRLFDQGARDMAKRMGYGFELMVVGKQALQPKELSPLLWGFSSRTYSPCLYSTFLDLVSCILKVSFRVFPAGHGAISSSGISCYSCPRQGDHTVTYPFGHLRLEKRSRPIFKSVASKATGVKPGRLRGK